MKTPSVFLLLALTVSPVPYAVTYGHDAPAERMERGRKQGNLELGFRNPPEATRPWCYWYWISDNISKEGITGDLEAMARAGIGEALIGNIFQDNVPAGDVKVLSEPWWELIEHAIREGGRVGVNIGMFNCPGWSQSGGPWIKPDQAMRYLVSSETHVRGPARFEQKLAPPAEPFQDVALLAFPTPQSDADSASSASPAVTSTPASSGLEMLIDGKLDNRFTFPAGAGQGNSTLAIDFELAEPFTARSLSLFPADSPCAAECELQTGGEDGSFRTVRAFRFDRSNMSTQVGPMPLGPVTVSFAPATARRFRLVLKNVTGQGALAEIDLSAAARLDSFIEKQLGKMHPTPLPTWSTHLWPAGQEPDSPKLSIPSDQVRNLSAKLAADGTLRWEVPPGDWVILRTGMTTTGVQNAPSSPEGIGLEVDKMNRDAAKLHFDAFIGQLLRRMPAAERTAFKHVVADSYETGSLNWTDGFGKSFSERYGYDPMPWLPVLTGRIVGSANQSDRFLWDLRRLVADRVATDYVGGMRDLCHPHGLQLWLENYGHWGFPAEFLQYGGQSDRIAGEYWVTGELGSIECRAASSAANIYGKSIVSAEAFTGGPAFQTTPQVMKARGDWSLCEGINHFVLHVYIHQPWNDRIPGMNAWFGTEFNRHNTWFDAGGEWIDYLRRCSFMLQQGWRVADVAYFIGEDTPKMTGTQTPKLPPGRDFDYINAEAIQNLSVVDGLLTLPHGTSYRVLVLPPLPTMRPELLRKVRDLVQRGATVLGPPPLQSPSLANYPACDAEVQKLAADLWGKSPVAERGGRPLGAGRVIWGKGLDEVLSGTGLPPDFTSDAPLLHTHRAAGDTHLYFVSNQQPHAIDTRATFRVDGLAPEFWWPQTGRVEKPAVYQNQDGTVQIPIHLGPQGSVFVVFRDQGATPNPIVSVTRNGQPLDQFDAIELTRGDSDQVEALVRQPGRYELRTADGQTQTLTVDTIPEPMAVVGPWQVRFAADKHEPKKVTFEQLTDWTKRPEPVIMHYSGTATYRKTVNLPAVAEGKRIYLNLGKVRDLATVRWNGKPLGTLWLAPWRVEITAVARPGENMLEVDVVNPWNNRLVGDAALPPAERTTYLAADTLAKDAALMPAGLLGPVTIETAVWISK